MIQIKFNIDRNFANFHKEGDKCILETDVEHFPASLADELDRCESLSVSSIDRAPADLYRLTMKVLNNADEALSDICESITATYGGSLIIRRIPD